MTEHPTALKFTVHGDPKPQGSKRHVGNGVLVEQVKGVRPWRQAVSWAAIECMGGAGRGVRGAVNVFATFTLRKPASAPKKRKTWPSRKPDLDKLCRALLDALTDAGAIEDDARVVWLSAAKVFPGQAQDALKVPGAVIVVKAVSEQ